jgi:hypothetical protein
VVATIEELLEGWAKTFHDHGIIFTLSSEPIKRGDTGASGKVLVNIDFILELEVVVMERFKLNSDFFP